MERVTPRPRVRRWPTMVLWLTFLVCLVLLLATFVDVSGFLAKPLIRNESPTPVEVVIVLGGGVVTDLRILPWDVQERVQKGVEMYTEGYATRFILSGGQVKGQPYTESEVMHEYVNFFNIPPADVFEENASRSTRENAEYSQALMAAHNFRTALLVTSDYHSKRACKAFRKLNITVTCIAAFRDASDHDNYYRNLVEFRSVLREYAVTIYYWLRGYI